MPHDNQNNVAERLEHLRSELRAEQISYGELAELQSLASHIAPDDVELLEAAGVPEFRTAMPNTPKHLQGVSSEALEIMRRGFNRFRFGFAEPGEKLMLGSTEYTFLGDFGRRRDADQCATDHGGTANPYLCGKRARGWAVFKRVYRNPL